MIWAYHKKSSSCPSIYWSVARLMETTGPNLADKPARCGQGDRWDDNVAKHDWDTESGCRLGNTTFKWTQMRYRGWIWYSVKRVDTTHDNRDGPCMPCKAARGCRVGLMKGPLRLSRRRTNVEIGTRYGGWGQALCLSKSRVLEKWR